MLGIYTLKAVYWYQKYIKIENCSQWNEKHKDISVWFGQQLVPFYTVLQGPPTLDGFFECDISGT